MGFSRVPPRGAQWAPRGCLFDVCMGLVWDGGVVRITKPLVAQRPSMEPLVAQRPTPSKDSPAGRLATAFPDYFLNLHVHILYRYTF